MEEFFTENSSFSPLKEVFSQNGIGEESFYQANEDTIHSLVKDYPDLMMGFLAKYHYERGARRPLIMMDLDLVPVDDDSSQDSSDTSAASTSTSAASDTSVNDSVTFVENDLFRMLNHPDNLEGQIILGKYMRHKKIDAAQLKRVWVIDCLKKDRRTYSIKSAQFKNFVAQADELFVGIDKNVLYIPYTKDANGKPVSARGGAYTEYKHWRRELRDAGLFDGDDNDDDDDIGEVIENVLQERSNNSQVSLNSVISPESKDLELASLITKWQGCYDDRIEFLKKKPSKQGIDRTSAYLGTFPCLSTSSCIPALETDFQRTSRLLLEKKEIDEVTLNRYARILSDDWPLLSFKVASACKPSRVKEIKALFKAHGALVLKENCCYSVLGLQLLPLAITVPRSVKISVTETHTFQKDEISKAFILVSKDFATVDSDIINHQAWLAEKKQTILPFLVFVGEPKNVLMSYVVINGIKHEYPDPVRSVQACYKCLIALGKFPYLTEHIWEFFRKSIYKAPFKKMFIPVSKFLSKLQ